MSMCLNSMSFGVFLIFREFNCLKLTIRIRFAWTKKLWYFIKFNSSEVNSILYFCHYVAVFGVWCMVWVVVLRALVSCHLKIHCTHLNWLAILKAVTNSNRKDFGFCFLIHHKNNIHFKWFQGWYFFKWKSHVNDFSL